MSHVLLIDGVRYYEWSNLKETEDLEPMVNKHAKDIFGENSEYFDVKKQIESCFGRNRIPDGYVIDFKNNQWHIVEIELSSHQVDQHIREQVNDFIVAIKSSNLSNRNIIANAIYDSITKNDFLRYRLQKMVAPEEIHKYLFDLITKKQPILSVIIERKSEELKESLQASLRYSPIDVLEFRTFKRENADNICCHLFETTYSMTVKKVPDSGNESTKDIETVISGENSFELVLKSSHIQYHWLDIPSNNRSLFPNINRAPLAIDTDKGLIEIRLSIYPTRKHFLQGKGLTDWFKVHPELKLGDRVRITVVEPMKKYRLEIVKS